MADSGDFVPLVYNPMSGGGRGQGRYEEIARKLRAVDLPFTPHKTNYPGHATVLCRQLAKEGHDRIYVIGGDGTVSEAANGILDLRKRPTLGCIPAGTGNDFLRDFGCLDADEAIQRILTGKTRQVDAGRIRYRDEAGSKHERFFINIFGTGFAPSVTDLTNRKLKWLKDSAYHAAVLIRLIQLRPIPTRVTLDGVVQDGDFPLVMVCNSIHTGGAMKMAPGADATDGWFDVVIAEGLGRAGLLKLFPKIFDGSHADDPRVRIERAKEIRIEPVNGSRLLADGEVYGNTPVSIDMMPGALRILQ